MTCFGDDSNGIWAQYWVHLNEVSLHFNSSWTPGLNIRIYKKHPYGGEFEEDWYIMYNCPRSVVWEDYRSPILDTDDIPVECDGYDGGPPHTSVLAEWEEIRKIVQKGEYDYHGGIDKVACFKLDWEFGFGKSTISFTAYKRCEYITLQASFKLSVIVEFVNRDDFNHLLKYQQFIREPRGLDDGITQGNPLSYAGRGNTLAIEQTKSPFQNQRNDVTNDLRHVAHEAIPLAFKQSLAQSEAIERGLPYSDFIWENPNGHERRIVHHKACPSSQTATCLRALRLDLFIFDHISPIDEAAKFYISEIEFNITSNPPNPLSYPHAFSSIRTLHIDVPDAAPANKTAHDSSCRAQSFGISLSGTNSAAIGTCITTDAGVVNININGPLQGPLQILGPVSGDIISGSIYGGNIGGRNNTNYFTAPATIETVVSAVLRAIHSGPGGESHSMAQYYHAGRKRKIEEVSHDEVSEDMERARKRQAR